MASQFETETDTSSGVENPCPVCLETMNGKNQFTTVCGHQFCASCILSNSEFADSCPLCRAEIGIEVPNAIRNLNRNRMNENENNIINSTRRHNNTTRTMHLLEVDRVIDHLRNSIGTTTNHTRHMVWNDIALLFNLVFTRNNLLDRPTHEMLQRELSDIAHRNFSDALNDFITNDIRTYLSDVVENLEINPEIDDILNTLDQNSENLNNNIFSIQNYILENFDNTNIINEINNEDSEEIEEVD